MWQRVTVPGRALLSLFDMVSPLSRLRLCSDYCTITLRTEHRRAISWIMFELRTSLLLVCILARRSIFSQHTSLPNIGQCVVWLASSLMVSSPCAVDHVKDPWSLMTPSKHISLLNCLTIEMLYWITLNVLGCVWHIFETYLTHIRLASPSWTIEPIDRTSKLYVCVCEQAPYQHCINNPQQCEHRWVYGIWGST